MSAKAIIIQTSTFQPLLPDAYFLHAGSSAISSTSTSTSRCYVLSSQLFLPDYSDFFILIYITLHTKLMLPHMTVSHSTVAR
jgi:hypothetical protein